MKTHPSKVQRQMREQNRHNQKKNNHQKSGKDLIQRGVMVGYMK
jgi:hypothetical protein